MTNFKQRMDFMSAWLYDGEPPAFWLPGLFFPQVGMDCEEDWTNGDGL